MGGADGADRTAGAVDGAPGASGGTLGASGGVVAPSSVATSGGVAASGAPAAPSGSTAPSGRAAIPLEIAASYRARSRGLLGRDGIDGALLLTPASAVHTFRMRFAIDVAYLTRDLTVLTVRTMRPGRLGLPRLRARHVLEAEAGAMARWGLRPGVRVTVDAP
ncbi:hypothetical protein DF17_09750 [Streptomyces rimosus]|uniref:DUF192 domain-containing protein n=2 Tax=Streptomyces rimosus subsp. rimosus TaxID=132474 RepID=L8EQH0_STRR1|nr:hypothetical protein DF17_09750 [Streptomyces rimosus]MYT46265.1 DUF192 domain-containing protein [Streptomyces sp. SID5471]QGY71812.1 DUF192 domain-containing protein [Streptomyces rimosus R6-500]QST86173.1 DUF192 domain-containing protein [Streptomyces rimosus subsp. rimosus ATCC 10970]QTL91598.1 DUF192 domain-containing protein [Streptomyces rimosus subsp. rimosus]